MKKLIMTYEDYIPNEDIRKGDVFHGIYEVVSVPKITKNGYEWKVYHRRWHLYLRMIRPDPTVFLNMADWEQQKVVSCYQRCLIPKQLYPWIEAFYDVRHIAGSTAFFTEWCGRGTLRDYIKSGELYVGNDDEVEKRLNDIARLTAELMVRYENEVSTPLPAPLEDNIMITDDRCLKISCAATCLWTDFSEKEHETISRWALMVLEMYTGKKLWDSPSEADESFSDYLPSFKAEMPVQLKKVVCVALAGFNLNLPKMLPDYEHLLFELGIPTDLTSHYVDMDAFYDNNHALRLIDCGKWEAAGRELTDLVLSFPNIPLFRYNLMLLERRISENKMTESFGGVSMFDMLREPTDILLFAEWNDRQSVQRLIDQYGDHLPEYVARYLPEIHEKLLGRPRMTREDFKEGDPRIRKWDEEIVIALDGKEVTFKPTPEGCEKVNIPSKDGLVWNKNRLILPDSGIIKELDYTVREFDGKRFLFDEGFERLLAVSENNARLYPVAQYDNRFRAPFLLYRNTL